MRRRYDAVSRPIRAFPWSDEFDSSESSRWRSRIPLNLFSGHYPNPYNFSFGHLNDLYYVMEALGSEERDVHVHGHSFSGFGNSSSLPWSRKERRRGDR